MSVADCSMVCRQHLVDEMAERGIDGIATTEPLLVLGPYTMPPMKCPHGTRYWTEPTGEQIAQWVRDRTP